MWLLQSGNPSMNLFIFFFLIFPAQIIEFDGNDVPVNIVLRKKPIHCQTQFVWMSPAPCAKLGLIPETNSFLEALVGIGVAPLVREAWINHIFSANIQGHL